MSDKVFLDTNIFVYSVDTSSHHTKRDLARKLVIEHIRNGTGVLSIQVFQEFYQAVTQKLQVPLSANDAVEYLQYMAILETVVPDLDMIISAIRLHQQHSFSFWDSLIIQTARFAKCSVLFSEDLQHGFQLGSLVIENPFQ